MQNELLLSYVEQSTFLHDCCPPVFQAFRMERLLQYSNQ